MNEMLKNELNMILSNIERIKCFVEDPKNIAYEPNTSHVFGELKHRLTALKQTTTTIKKMSTRNLFRK